MKHITLRDAVVSIVMHEKMTAHEATDKIIELAEACADYRQSINGTAPLGEIKIGYYAKT